MALLKIARACQPDQIHPRKLMPTVRQFLHLIIGLPCMWRLLAKENEKMSNDRFIDLEVVLATDSAISDPLSVREGDILGLIAQGRSNKEIARSLCIAPETVKTHVKHIFVKLNVEKRAQAVSRAYNLRLVGAP